MSPIERNGNRELLIVEDSPTQSARLEHLLVRQGYQVVHAPNGRAALEAVARRKPDLVVSDVVMPEMDGFELCRRLKEDPASSEIPVILVTTLSDPGDVIRGLESGADNFIIKPYDERHLLDRVDFVLLNRKIRRVEHGGVAVEVYFHGKRHLITADRMQILNLLLSTYEAAIQRNRELTRAKEALAESEERTRSILATAHDAFVAMDSRGMITEWNLAAERIFGWSRDEVLGSALAELIIPPASREAHHAGVEHLLRTGEGPILNRRIEVRALRRSGEEFPIELLVWAIPRGEHMTFNAFMRDITEQAEAQAAIRQAKEEAERANRAKSEFLSRMSHDLRTPLNAILGFAQLIDLEAATPDQTESARQILRGGRHLLELINEVLDIARIEAGHLSLSPELIDVGEVVLEVTELITPLAASRRIALVRDVPPECGRRIHADRQRYRQILLNLVGNAVKYNRDGGEVRIACENASAGTLRTSVSDTGKGIAPEKLSLLFQPFERLGAEAEPIEGTGLGLTLAKGLAHAMGGALGVSSTVGQGSTFWVDLPAANPGDAPRPVFAPPPSAPVVAAASGVVLYVEDNASNVRLIERILGRRPGVRLLSASTGTAGLKLAHDESPDLILLDLHLPDMSGQEVLLKLSAEPRTRNIPVAVLSADAMAGQSQRLLSAGAIAYLTKPLDIVQLLRLVDDRLPPRREPADRR